MDWKNFVVVFASIPALANRADDIARIVYKRILGQCAEYGMEPHSVDPEDLYDRVYDASRTAVGTYDPNHASKASLETWVIGGCRQATWNRVRDIARERTRFVGNGHSDRGGVSANQADDRRHEDFGVDRHPESPESADRFAAQFMTECPEWADDARVIMAQAGKRGRPIKPKPGLVKAAHAVRDRMD